MGKSKKDKNGEVASATRINVHEARLRKILQVLKERNATISIDHDLESKSKRTRYGEGDHADHKLKELFLTVWEGTSDWTYYEYFKKDFTVNTKKTIKKKHHPSYEKFITGIQCTFLNKPGVKNAESKEQLFYSGYIDMQQTHMQHFLNFVNG